MEELLPENQYNMEEKMKKECNGIFLNIDAYLMLHLREEVNKK